MTYQQIYDESIKNGCTPAFADMLASRRPPGSNTEREFTSGIGTLADQFKGAEDQLEAVVGEARKMGYNPNMHDWYNSNLATCVGDPAAFIPPDQGRAHIRKVCEARDQDCTEADGTVIAKRSRRGEPLKSVPIAENIIQRKIRQQIKRDPSLKLKPRQELREAIIAKHSGD